MLNVYLNLINNKKDKKQFEKLCGTYQKQLFELAYLILKNSYDAENVVHDIFHNIATSNIGIVVDNKDEKHKKIIFLNQLKLFP